MEPVVDQLSPTLAIWHRHDATVKAELFSTYLRTASGPYLIDPIPLAPSTLDHLLNGEKTAGIIVTNVNHIRAASDLCRRLGTIVFAHPDVVSGLEECELTSLADGSVIGSQITTVTVEGAPHGEIALHHASEGGTMILGDALINMGSLGFTFLPAKYCSNQKQMRRSLRKLLDYRFERLLFAHGMPIVAKAHDRLTALLNEF